MTASSQSSPRGALEAVRELEAALEEQHDSHAVAGTAVDDARAEAERLLVAARRAGTDAGRRRRAAVLSEAEAEATAIRAAGEAEAAELLGHVSAGRDGLVAELTALLLQPEA
jgi:cell division septum initiation protein DivIVA